MTLLRSKECCSFCLFCWSPPWPAPTRCPPSGWASRSCTRWWWSSSWCRQVPAWDQRGLHRLHVRDWGELVHKTGESLISGSSLFASKLLSIQIACALYPTATNKNLGGNRVGIDTSSTFKSTSIEFEFGVPFDETTGDGTEVRTTATLSGNSLIKDQVYFKKRAFCYFPLSQLPHQSSAESCEVKRGFEDRDTQLQEQRSDYGACAHHPRQGQH